MNTDVVIIGAGPAGLTAAIELAKKKFEVVVLDEYYRSGGRLLGQLYEDPKAPQEHRHWDGQKIARQLEEKAKAVGVTILCGVTAWTVSGQWHIEVSGTTVPTIECKALLLATGAAEKALPLPGWTLPGVVSIGAAQTFTNLHHIMIGQRVIVVGVDPLSLSVVMEMKQAGIEVIGVTLPPPSPLLPNQCSPLESLHRLTEVAELAPNPLLRLGGKLLKGGLKKAALHFLQLPFVRVEGVPLQLRKAVIEIKGTHEVEAVVVQSVTVDGQLVGQPEEWKVDAVCLSAGLYPVADLAQVAGCPLLHVPQLGGAVPLHGPAMQTPIPNLYVAGNITGIEGAKVAMAQGKLAAASIAQACDRGDEQSIEEAIENVNRARDLSPIRFLPDIEQGRAEMKKLWEAHLREKEGIRL